MLASRFGSKAVEFLLAGQSNVMIGLAGNAIYSVPIHEVVSKQRILPMDIYEMGRILSQ
jgi:6-phosphofructokinase 1